MVNLFVLEKAGDIGISAYIRILITNSVRYGINQCSTSKLVQNVERYSYQQEKAENSKCILLI
jgi:hypothetical protein